MNAKLMEFEKNERLLAEKLFSQFNGVKNYTFTKGIVCYDAEITLENDTKILSELKVRSFPLNKYEDYILEVVKLISLIKKANNKKRILYINFFESEIEGMKDFIIFDITSRFKEWKENPPVIKRQWMNRTTFKLNNVKVEKEIILLKYNPQIDRKGSISLN